MANARARPQRKAIVILRPCDLNAYSAARRILLLRAEVPRLRRCIFDQSDRIVFVFALTCQRS